MATQRIELSGRDLGGGAAIDKAVFEITLDDSAGTPRIDGDRVKVGLPFDPATGAKLGTPSMKTKATIVTRNAKTDFLFGLKQLVFHRGASSLFAGVKQQDGSITEGTTGVNFKFTLDVQGGLTAANVFAAPWAPFYSQTPSLAKDGTPLELTIVDAPGGSAPLKRRNNATDRLNFLIASSQSADFVTLLVVQRKDGSHLPIGGFLWKSEFSYNVQWTGGTPTLVSPSLQSRFDSKLDSLPSGDERAVLFANAKLGAANSIVHLINDSMAKANLRHASAPIAPTGAPSQISITLPNYAIDQFPRYTPEVTRELGLSPFRNPAF